MEINGAAGKYPIRDIWSNEGGGRALEDQRRYGDRIALETAKTSDARTISRFEVYARNAQNELARQQSSFLAK